MIVIEAKLKSAISKDRDKFWGKIEICNDGTGTNTERNYTYTISKFGGKGVWKSGTLKNFDGSDGKGGIWDILTLCLIDAIGKRAIKFIKEPVAKST